jgi:hypothetical protein
MVGAVVAAASSGCASAPSQRVIYTGELDTGPGSVEAVRRQFAGRWELVSYDVFNEPGQPTTLAASGRLNVDAFGNVEFEGRLDETNAAGQASARLLNGSGRLMIDVEQQRYLIEDLEGNVRLGEDAFAQAPIESFRYYEFEGDLLHVAIKNPAGEVTAQVTYRRVQ